MGFMSSSAVFNVVVVTAVATAAAAASATGASAGAGDITSAVPASACNCGDRAAPTRFRVWGLGFGV